jgi:hypothetical protein
MLARCPHFSHGAYHADSTSAFESYTAHMGLGEAVQHSRATHFLYPLMLRSLAMDLFFPMGMRATEGGRLPEI